MSDLKVGDKVCSFSYGFGNDVGLAEIIGETKTLWKLTGGKVVFKSNMKQKGTSGWYTIYWEKLTSVNQRHIDTIRSKTKAKKIDKHLNEIEAKYPDLSLENLALLNSNLEQIEQQLAQLKQEMSNEG